MARRACRPSRLSYSPRTSRQSFRTCAPCRCRQPHQRRVERQDSASSRLCKLKSLQAENSGNQLSKGEALMTNVRSILLASAASLGIAGLATSNTEAEQTLDGAM